MHRHLREGDEMLSRTTKGLELFGFTVVMPNLIEPVTVESCQTYCADIRNHNHLIDGNYRLGMTFQFTGQTQTHDAIWATSLFSHAFGVKLYPQGMTTNSEYGIADFSDPRLQEFLLGIAESSYGRSPLVVMVHCEAQSDDRFETERNFLPIFERLVTRHARLKVVLEHVSTRQGVELVRSLSDVSGYNVFATITLHHALCHKGDVYNRDGSIKNPFLHCKPAINARRDRDAVYEAMISGKKCFGFGSDSAPHLVEKKLGDKSPAGVYVPPDVAICTLVEEFEKSGGRDWQARLENFACRNAAAFYGIKLPGGIELVEDPWVVPAQDDGLVPFKAGEQLMYRITTRI